MRIAYGVFGYGRGHATRSAAILPELIRRHELLIFAGGDAYDALFTQYPVVHIPTLGYRYGRNGRASEYLTLRRNAWNILDLLFRGPTWQLVHREMQGFRPDVVISDAEPWTHRAARRLGIPRIGFDHFGIMVHCRPRIPWEDRLRSRRDVFFYRALMGRPQRVIVSSFYPAPPKYPGVSVVGPLLRDEVLHAKPTGGPHLLAYFNKGRYQFSAQIEQTLQALDVPVLVYGTGRRGTVGRLSFRPPSNLPFLEDMASCRAIISTAGNQLVGEALHLGKPLLAMPEHSVEQRLNAAAVSNLNVGMSVRWRDFSVAVVREFLSREGEYLANIRHLARNGRDAALAAIEQFLDEVAHEQLEAVASANVSS